MIFKNFDTTDRNLLRGATVTLIIAILLLWQDDWIYRLVQVNKGDLEEIGEVQYADKDVRRRYEIALSWLPIKKSNKVYQGDSIFTGDDSTATIVTKEGEEISIDSNSLVVITKRKDSIGLNIGFGSVQSKSENNKKFLITSNDRLTEIAVSKGSVKIDAGEGNKLLLNLVAGQVKLKTAVGEKLLESNETTEIEDYGQTVDRLASHIQPLSPSQNAYFKFRDDKPMLFKWKSPRKFSRTKIKIATDSYMNNIVSESRVDTDHYAAYNLPKDEILYWQVLAEGGQMEPQKFSIAGDIPPFPISPKTGFQFYYDSQQSSLNPGSLVTLEWAPGSIAEKFEVQLATDFEFKSTVKSYKVNERKLDLGLLTAGSYFWRVRSFEFQGERWSEPSFFKVGPEPSKLLSAPVPQIGELTYLLPTKMHNLSPDKMGTLSKRGLQKYVSKFPILAWSSVKDADDYLLQVSPNKTFSNTLVNEMTSQKYYQWKNIEPGNYYWRIKGQSSKYKDGAFTHPQKIKIMVAPPVALSETSIIDEIPDPVMLNLPPPPLNLKWNPTVFTSEYLVEFSASSEFKNSTKFITRNSEKKIQIPKPGIYFWRITSLDKFHIPISPPSTNYTIEFQRIYKDPALEGNLIALSPKSHESIIIVGSKNPSLTFKWTKPFAKVNYRLEMSYDSTFDRVFYSAQTQTNKFVYNNKFRKKIIYWRVRAENSTFVSSWSDPSRFTISYEGDSFQFENSDKLFLSRLKAQERQNQILAIQKRRLNQLRSPASLLRVNLDRPTFLNPIRNYLIKSNIDPRIDGNKVSSQPTTKFFDQVLGNPTFEWTKAPATEKYIFEIAKDIEFKKLVTKIPTYSPRYSWEKAQPGKYFYRVRAHNNRYSPSDFSDVHQLDIKITAPYVTSEDHFVEVFDEPKEFWQPPRPIILKWMPVVFARFYEIEFSNDKDFSLTKIYTTNSNELNIKVWSTGTYYWRIRALNGNRVAISQFSQVRSVEVNQIQRMPASVNPLAAVFPFDRTLIFVGDGLMHLAFIWNDLGKNSNETLEISKSPEFSEIITSIKGSFGKAIVNSSLPGGKLYWRVKSKNQVSKVNQFMLRKEQQPYVMDAEPVAP